MKLPNVLGDGFLKALPAAERRKLGKAGMTSEEAILNYSIKKEKELQQQIANWLRLHRHYFVTPRLDKKTTTRKGTPDFIVCVKDGQGNGRFLCLEAKIGHAKLSEEQEDVMAEATHSGATYCVVRSLEEVIRVINAILISYTTPL